MGLVPRRIDVLTAISGVSCDQAVREATRVEWRGVVFRVIGRAALLVNKRASARPKDIEDVRLLDEAGPNIAIAGIAVLCAPVLLGVDHIYSMNALDHLWWAIGFEFERTRAPSLAPSTRPSMVFTSAACS